MYTNLHSTITQLRVTMHAAIYQPWVRTLSRPKPIPTNTPRPPSAELVTLVDKKPIMHLPITFCCDDSRYCWWSKHVDKVE